MVHGRYRHDFKVGTVLSFFGGLITWLAVFGLLQPALAVGAVPMALIGMMLFESAYVQAGQSVPLA